MSSGKMCISSVPQAVLAASCRQQNLICMCVNKSRFTRGFQKKTLKIITLASAILCQEERSKPRQNHPQIQKAESQFAPFQFLWFLSDI